MSKDRAGATWLRSRGARTACFAGAALCGAVAVIAFAAAPGTVSVGALQHDDVGQAVHQVAGGYVPISLSIPAIGLTTAVRPVDVNGHGQLEPPSSTAVGWWRGGARVGARGAAVIVGHVDSPSGPSVFQQLHTLRPGEIVIVQTYAGPWRFVVDALRQYPRSHLPSSAVFGVTDRPALRLITCGRFSWVHHHYLDNLVVFAHLSDAPRSTA
jgi:sortase (surface protein transpeptidase)